MKLEFFPSSSRSYEERRRRCQDESIRFDMTADYHQFGYDYFDNSELRVGYGGYYYDGRYAGAVEKICQHYGLKPGDRVLEIGCAKGFVLVEFYKLGLKVAGLDISEYAVQHAHSNIRRFIQVGDGCQIPFEDKSFDFVLAKEILPHIPEDRVDLAISECLRVSKGAIFFEIQSGKTSLELEDLQRWDGTHMTMRAPEWWDALLASLGYKGDVHYNILIPEGE